VKVGAAVEAARRGRLYPAVILHGGGEGERRAAALELARALLCAEAPGERPCGVCRHCRRIVWPAEGGGGGEEEAFHPDFAVVARDLKTATSVEAARRLVQAAQLSPFEARGQVFAVANAETLSPEAANSLLKALEEPGGGAPRHFLLLAPSQFDLLPTLRSRSLAVYLGAAEAPARGELEPVAAAFAAAVSAFAGSGAAVFLLAAADALRGAGDWDDPRSGRPWSRAAAAVVAAAREGGPPAGGREGVLAEDPWSGGLPAGWRRRLLALAEELIAAPAMRVRGIPAERILEGLVARHLGEPSGRVARNLL
jgi:hypothetical protein